MPDLRSKKTQPMPTAEQQSDQARRTSAAANVDGASVRRRSLLKAAVSAAPVIATLPSGEALAQSSALQCVISEQNGDKSPPEDIEPQTVPPADNYARLAGTIERWVIPDPTAPTSTISVEVFHVTIDGDEIYVYGRNTATGIPSMGSWFDRSIAKPPIPLKTDAAEFLYGYKADTSPLTDKNHLAVDSATLAPEECVIDPGIPSWPGPLGTPSTPAGPDEKKHCIFPFAVKADVETPGNVPLTYSCLASFQRAL
jgi:hypothetical protein